MKAKTTNITVREIERQTIKLGELKTKITLMFIKIDEDRGITETPYTY